jgi:hypothetical protein
MNYRIIYRKQDLGLRVSSLYQQQQLAVGILDSASKEELSSSIEWYLQNMNTVVYVLTTEYRLEETNLALKYPDATFIVFKNNVTTGEFINAFANECYATYFLVVRSDCSLVAFEGDKLMEIMEDKAHPAVITPVMVSGQGEILPTVRAPFLKGRTIDPLSFMPDMESDKAVTNLYPLMGMGLFDRALFQRLRAFDNMIFGEFFQMLDFGVRCFLMGYSIVTTKALAFVFPKRVSVIEDRSECEGVNRFYTKAMSVRKLAGKNVVSKWKPYVDKDTLNDEVKKKQINLQKTDFFTLVESWKISD